MRFFSIEYLSIIGAIALAAVCWGAYGPVLHRGQTGHGAKPPAAVRVRGHRPTSPSPSSCRWSSSRSTARREVGSTTNASGLHKYTGILWSLGGGAAGAIGALGIILAFNFGGKPTYVMPLVFGFAPVVNAFLTIYMSGTWKEFTPMRMSLFFAGLILVAVGAVTVLATVAARTRAGRPPRTSPESQRTE